MSKKIHEEITRQIVLALKSGNLPPWRKPWRNDPNAGFPCNVVSKRSYRGINPLLLEIASMRHGFQSKHWGTFRQWSDELGGKVMRRPEDVPRGKWGTTIIFWKPIKKTEVNDAGEDVENSFYVLRTYTVFNIDQVVGDFDHLRVGHAEIEVDPQERFEHADAVIAATEANIRYGGNQAFYNPVSDFIQCPHRHQFETNEFYETMFHELAHWTEHESRLNWQRTSDKRNYALAELIAEIGSCFLCSELGIPVAEQNSVAYLQGWLKEMEDDPKFIFDASTQASRAVDYLMAFSREPEPALA